MSVGSPQAIVSKVSRLIYREGSPLELIQRRCSRIAASDATVLVLGETGTGKEVVARLLHQQSSRQSGPFIPVNCGAIPETLLESELFGYVKGAFTGAINHRRGRVALAEGGTLFLDEIGDLPLSLQVKLLRLLQDRTYEPIGSSQSVAANFRLIAATHRDLAAEVEAGRFRQDLYYRLLVCPVKLPALRERRGDIVPLFSHFWKSRGEQRPVEPAALALLERCDWPGNVREIENLAERLAVCSEGEVIRLEDVQNNLVPDGDLLERSSPRQSVSLSPAEIPPAQSMEPQAADELVAAETAPRFPIDLPTFIRNLEERYISAALAHTAGNKRAAADLLGLQRTTLVEKLRRRTVRDGSLPVQLLEPTGS